MDVLQHPEQLIYTHAVLFVKACWVDLLGGGDNCYQFLQFLLELVGSVFPTPNPSTLQTGMLFLKCNNVCICSTKTILVQFACMHVHLLTPYF